MSNGQENFQYFQGVDQLEETVYDETRVNVDNFDFDRFYFYTEPEPNNTTTPNLMAPPVFDDSEYDQLRKMRATDFQNTNYQEEQNNYPFPPTPLPTSPIVLTTTTPSPTQVPYIEPESLESLMGSSWVIPPSPDRTLPRFPKPNSLEASTETLTQLPDSRNSAQYYFPQFELQDAPVKAPMQTFISQNQNLAYYAQPYVQDAPVGVSMQFPPSQNRTTSHFVQSYLPEAPMANPTPLPAARGEQRQGTEYLNPILNCFEDPSSALRIIDKLQNPLPRHVQQALEREVAPQLHVDNEGLWSEPQRESNTSPRRSHPYQTARDARTRASPPPEGEGAPLNNGRKKAGNMRPINIKNFNPTAFYSPLPHVPHPWGQGPYDGVPLFHYNAVGELNPSSTFSVEELLTYIQLHPLNTNENGNSGLTIWIQVAPADSGKRYGSVRSDKCRFECCPDPQRTIRKGDFRIAFDEQYSKGLNTDPFHNAGYVHLYCMEKFLDFPYICKIYNVRPDTRNLREGKNKMALTRDHGSMEDVALNFIQNAQPWMENGYNPAPVECYEQTLCHRLTIEHLARQPRHLQRIREERQGNSIDTHLNNLDKYLAGRREQEHRRKQGSRPKFGVKRRADAEYTLEDEVPDDNVQAGKSMERRSQRTYKKARRE